ncbi:MAG: DUF4892 domain-containing protein [Marinobacter sp.]|uniref:DUF4892 domain-containing protein n=1 Tax=Marinobacter sp. TaxID=50741 RepID=UPI00299E2B53|nr:DUF4892 domain-containing protein [Marinobacter sp.]MDX1633141.1 DUF4892 domain-containing protein [Marinobacter sp.]
MAAPIEPYERASLELERPIQSSSHRILLSPVREVNDEIRSESIIRPAVEGVGQLLQVNRDASRSAARKYYLDQLDERNAVILFRCTGRDCGRSNVWANQIFNEARLYGRDINQDYLAAAYKDTDGVLHLVLVYTVTRGNQREYVWVEQLTTGPDAVVPGFSTGSARIRGPVIVSWSGGVTFQFDYDAAARRQLQEWSAEPGSQVLLNSYTVLGDDQSLADAMDRARQAADSLATLLGKSGVSREQIVPVIIGPAVRFEDPSRQGNRIEVKVVSQP